MTESDKDALASIAAMLVNDRGVETVDKALKLTFQLGRMSGQMEMANVAQEAVKKAILEKAA